MRLLPPQWLRNNVPPRLRDWVRRRQLMRKRVEGVPPAIDGQMLSEIGRSMLGSEPTRVSYVNVSGYKENNAYVVWVSDDSGQHKRFVHKTLDLREETFPAIFAFPGPVGWPEINAYIHPNQGLNRFLPRLLRHVESHEGMVHEFFLEDLNSTHRMTFSRRDVVRCSRALLDLERALRAWMPDVSPDQMMRYDGTFPAAFLDYAHTALDGYVSTADDEIYVDLLRRWPEIAQWYLSETPDEAADRIHGDYRVSNIFHERANPDRIRVVDLEFAGYGWIHNDLASLLKGRHAEVAEEAVSIVAAGRPEWTNEEHWRMYQRCRLERGLLDASLLAGQRVAFSPNPRLSPSHAEEILSALSALNGGSSS